MPAPAPAPGLTFDPRDYDEFDATRRQVVLRGGAVSPAALREGVRSADFVVAFPGGPAVPVRRSRGGRAEPGDFRPREEPLEVGTGFSLASFGGRSSYGAIPRLDLAADGGGLIVAVGRTGGRAATFTVLGGGRLRVRAGRARFRPRRRIDRPRSRRGRCR